MEKKVSYSFFFFFLLLTFSFRYSFVFLFRKSVSYFDLYGYQESFSKFGNNFFQNLLFRSSDTKTTWRKKRIFITQWNYYSNHYK